MKFNRPPSYSSYPLLIRFESADQKLYIYMKPTLNFGQVHLIKTKLEFEGKGNFFEEVYGISKPDE